jgi:hypothetical protein
MPPDWCPIHVHQLSAKKTLLIKKRCSSPNHFIGLLGTAGIMANLVYRGFIFQKINLFLLYICIDEWALYVEKPLLSVELSRSDKFNLLYGVG